MVTVADGSKRIIDATYANGQYWAHRMDMMYYAYVDYILRTVARNANSMIDIGTANCPYIEKCHWIDERVSFDRVPPYSSPQVTGIEGDFLTHEFDRTFDVVTCLQVLEHVPKPRRFARKLLSLGKLVVVSVPYRWPTMAADDHVNDPVTHVKMKRWFGRKPNYKIVAQEPFRGVVGQRLICVYDTENPEAGYGRKDFKDRIRRLNLEL